MYATELREELDTIVRLVRGRLSTMERITLSALVVIEVHGLDILDELIENEISNPNEFEWEA